MTHNPDMISRAEADRQTQEAVAEATKLTVPVAAMDQHIKEAVAAALMEAIEAAHEADSLELATHGQSKIVERIRGLIDTDTLARLEARETAIQQQAYHKGYEDGARAEYESQALAAIRKGET